jgi:alkylhydroperoxidase/carboxymuconolactone decarboxylase family protein YurZ
MNLVIIKDIINRIKNEELLLCFFVSCITSYKINYLRVITEIMKERGVKSDKIYETILQSYLFCGFPVTIESMKIFNKVYTSFRKPKYDFNLLKYRISGVKNCNRIYKSNFNKLMDNFAGLSNELKEWMIIEGYGKVMGRPGLSLKTRELINTAMLTTKYFEHQLYSHIKGSLNTGSTYKEIVNVIKITEYFGGKRNVNKSIMLLKKIKATVRN